MLKLYSDGGSRGNPGAAAIGYVIYDEDDEAIYKKARPIGIATNNIAEYTALLEGLQKILAIDGKSVKAYLDSELVVKQIKGEYKVKNQDLKIVFDKIKLLIKKLDSFEINHVRREHNKEADKILNIALDTMQEYEVDSLNKPTNMINISESIKLDVKVDAIKNPFNNTLPKALERKIDAIYDYIRNDKKVVVAFSGGVDSSLLIKLCNDVLGENVVAVTIKGAHVPKAEFDEATELTKKLNIKHNIIYEDILSIKEVKQSGIERCYFCKKFLFNAITKFANEIGAKAIYDGSNLDDLSDYRPGMKALKELDIKSPFLDTMWTKQDIREYSKFIGLETHDKEAAACLISRVSYGQELTEEILNMIEKAEDFLKTKGLRHVRVRVHGELARIEMENDDLIPFMSLNLYKETYEYLTSIGFKYVSLDLGGYKTGNMNK